jgi:ATP-dependent DNA ligase
MCDTLGEHGRIRHAGHLTGSCTELWQLALELELEGIVAKDAASKYRAGRTTRWQEIKTAIGAEREAQRVVR